MELPKRYHPALVTLHWLIALLIFVNLYLGIFTLRNRGGARGFQAAGSNVAIHMAVGVTILVLLLVRFILRVRTSKPAPATAGNKFLDLLAVIVHYGLYLAVLVVTVLGLVFSFQSGRFQSTFLGTQSQFGPPPGGFPAVNGTPGAQPATPFNGFPRAGCFHFAWADCPARPGCPVPPVHAPGQFDLAHVVRSAMIG